MLSTITNFFDWVYGLVGSLWSFLTSILTGLFNIIKAIPGVISFTTSAIGYLPSILVAFATITITISVVYLIVGRN